MLPRTTVPAPFICFAQKFPHTLCNSNWQYGTSRQYEFHLVCVCVCMYVVKRTKLREETGGHLQMHPLHS